MVLKGITWPLFFWSWKLLESGFRVYLLMTWAPWHGPDVGLYSKDGLGSVLRPYLLRTTALGIARKGA